MSDVLHEANQDIDLSRDDLQKSGPLPQSDAAIPAQQNWLTSIWSANASAANTDPADYTLNKMPKSVEFDPKLFKVSLIGSVKGDLGGIVWYGASGDLTGDGYQEIVLSGWNSQGASAVPLLTFSALKSGTVLDNAQTLLGQDTTSGTAILRIADLNGDGRNDLVVMGHNESPTEPTQNTFFLSNPDGGFTITHPTPDVAAHEGEIGDINGDGLPDIITSTFAVGTGLDPSVYGLQPVSDGVSPLLLWINSGNGTFKPLPLSWDHSASDIASHSVTYQDWGGGSSSAIADLDGDGKAEVIVTDLRYSGNWQVGNSFIIKNITLGDTTAYGDLVKLPNPYFEYKAKFASIPSFSDPEKSHDTEVMAMDFNGDGRPDILINSMIWSAGETAPGAGIVQFLENEGNLKFKDVTNDVLNNYYVGRDEGGHEMRLIDVNGDGFLDIVEPGESAGVAVAKHWPAGWDGTQYIPADRSWSNDILINTGTGAFVSEALSTMHVLSQKEAAIFESLGGSVDPYNLVDQRMFPYVMPDGTVGFVAEQGGWSTDGPASYFFDFRATQPLSTGPGGINPASEGAPGFNEAFYLLEYPDVAAAVKAGKWSSGLDEYLHEGRAAGNFAFAPNATVRGLGGGDTIALREGNETAYGNGGNDRIHGEAGDDTLYGGAGNDVLTGGRGADHLIGGSGGDRFVYSRASESSSVHYDTITGFDAKADRFDFAFKVKTIDNAVAKGALSVAHFDTQLTHILNAAHLQAHSAVVFTPSAGSLRDDTFLVVDADGHAGYKAGADFVFLLDNAAHMHSLTAMDFV